MDTKQPENPPAFPQPPGHLTVNGDWITTDEPGMTLRDYFAAKAMQSIIRNNAGTSKKWDAKFDRLIAESSYEIADAMLTARAATGKGVQGE